ncbi:MAG: TetR/AcrR family transcriptional regulator, transcriptional repressor for nem operon [Mycobacterium sp.]|uniref:TetR/AcrR family transcriptional regulator n=1 Tax=Mycobacterium sp. TaxID=1785 RepID=UPI0028B95A10|nr:TetR/AcrR family transcriptional regulator [Mycobacterium sp.]MDT5118964.1 TetR/AcrR family transcriptional regulator, transcriptional repressor for nem operon [Mycobacterium sp.]
MRYPQDQKARARDALVRAGTRSLKTSGFNGVGVDGLAAAAGVTSGAFYSNFPNKTAMLEAVIEAGLGEPFVSDTGAMTPTDARAHMIAFLHEYISTDHSLDAAEGCVMPALSADVSRAEPAVKDAYQRKMIALIDRISELLDGEQSDRRRRAWSIVTLMVGSIVISRGMPEQSENRSAPLGSALNTALALIDGEAEPGG